MRPISSVRLYILLAPVFRDFPLGAVHACPEGVPARPTPKATEEVFRKGTQACLGGRSPKPERREANFGRESVRPTGGGALSAGTLNASTVESPIWSPVRLAHLVVSK